MSQKGIREVDGKRLLAHNWSIYFNELMFQTRTLSFTSHDELLTLSKQAEHAWLHDTIVIKPDMLFGKRGVQGLVFVGSLPDGIEWVSHKTQDEITLSNGLKGQLQQFMVEAFVDHTKEEELYLSFATSLDGDIINMSLRGGIDIEENWSSVQSMVIPPIISSDESRSKILQWLNGYSQTLHIVEFVSGLYNFFKDFEFSYLECNPFVIKNNSVYMLDLVAKLDTCAVDINPTKYGNIDFPKGLGFPTQSESERAVEELDAKSGSSLKLTVLRPNAPIWMLLAGGGGSVVYLDEAVRIFGVELVANYGEYSGNPSEQEMYQYSGAILDSLLARKTGDHPTLLVGGAIANFTDVAQTFKGLRRALVERAELLRNRSAVVLVRRSGPNVALGLQQIKQTLDEIGLRNEVYGAEVSMSSIVHNAKNY